MKITKNAKNAVYAVVGAGDAAVKGAASLPKRAATLPKRALKLGSFATGFVRDASKRFDRYVVRGRKLVERNGSKPRSARSSSKPKTAVTETPIVTSPVVEARSAEIPADVLG